VDENIELNGYTLTLTPDNEPESPLEWEAFVSVAFFHRRYDYSHGHGKYMREPGEWHEFVRENEVIAVPLYMLDHSGIRFSTSSYRAFDPQEWDSGQVGFVFVTREDVRKEYKVKRISSKLHARVLEQLHSFVEALDQYASGDVWCWDITDENDDIVDSCCGCFGYDYAMSEGEEALKVYADKRENAIALRAEGMGL
jgi:hypothetical protein